MTETPQHLAMSKPTWSPWRLRQQVTFWRNQADRLNKKLRTYEGNCSDLQMIGPLDPKTLTPEWSIDLSEVNDAVLLCDARPTVAKDDHVERTSFRLAVTKGQNIIVTTPDGNVTMNATIEAARSVGHESD